MLQRHVEHRGQPTHTTRTRTSAMPIKPRTRSRHRSGHQGIVLRPLEYALPDESESRVKGG